MALKRTHTPASVAKTRERPSRASSRLSKANIAPLKRSVLPERVSQVIIQGLLDGSLRPGDRLIESDLVDLLGVSRSPIREALTELAQSGVIDREPGRGGRIREWSKRDLEDLFGVRSELEGYAARLVCTRFKPQHRPKFDRIVASMRKAARARRFSRDHRTGPRIPRSALAAHGQRAVAPGTRESRPAVPVVPDLELEVPWRPDRGGGQPCPTARRNLEQRSGEGGEGDAPARGGGKDGRSAACS